jgi:hypothetical protein
MNTGFSTVAKEMSDVKQELLSYLKEVHGKAMMATTTTSELPVPAPTIQVTSETEEKPVEEKAAEEKVTEEKAGEEVEKSAQGEGMKDLSQVSKSNIAASVLADVKEKLKQVETIRRDMGVVRQLHDGFRSEMQGLIQGLREKSKVLKTQPITVTSARKYVDEGKEELDRTAEDITKRLEDLQDTIDELKLDVTSRKCRPSSTQMQHCDEEAKKLQTDIANLSDKIKTVKPMWKKTWEEELQNIVKEQQFLKDQEALLLDLEEDHTAILEVFGQLSKIREIQEKGKPTRREFRIPVSEAGHEGMNSVLKQVTTIQVDPERRLRALNQAEKMRERELANRIDEFEHELTSFVESKKLRMTGGAQEIERQRQKKNQNMLRQLYEKKKEKEKDGEDDGGEEGNVQDKPESEPVEEAEGTGDAVQEESTDLTSVTPVSEEPTIEEPIPVEGTSQDTEAAPNDDQSAAVTQSDQEQEPEPESGVVEAAATDAPAEDDALNETPEDGPTDSAKDTE